MKKVLLALSILLSAGFAARAQAPNAFNYQGVARNAAGSPIAGTAISLRLSVHDGSSSGTVVYQETQNVTTNSFGLFTAAIGNGTPVTGTFSGIAWSTGSKYMEVEIDPAGGSSYTSVGTSELLSVPYAIYAANGGGGTGTVTSVTAGTGLSGGTITTSGTISMPNVGTAGTYGSASTVPVITTDAQGRVSSVTTTTITPTTTWNLTGNSGTNSGSNFVGTKDTATLRFRVNNLWAGELNQNTSNVSYGPRAGMSNTTGNYNTAVGDSALTFNTAGQSNTAVGIGALQHNTIGNWNTALGEGALTSATADTENTALGIEALFANTTGSYNAAGGAASMTNNTTGSQNAAFGLVSLLNNTTGNYNAGFGGYALQTNTTGAFNTAVGYSADVNLGTYTNATALGSWAIVNGSNKVMVGASTVTFIGGYSSFINLSDGRFKTDIKENVPGLDFISKLKPVTYRFEARKLEHFLGQSQVNIDKRKESFDLAEAQVRTGFIAQDVEKAAQESGYDFSGVHKPTNDKDNYGLAYAEFTVPLVKAVQELNAKNEALQKQVEELLKRIETLENK
jgi:hypothetical protein